jgi:serine/threonine-protein kinase SRPK3
MADIPIPESLSSKSWEETLEGVEKERFPEFVRYMLQWKPEHRLTAKQLLEHPWLKNPVSTMTSGS